MILIKNYNSLFKRSVML